VSVSLDHPYRTSIGTALIAFSDARKARRVLRRAAHVAWPLRIAAHGTRGRDGKGRFRVLRDLDERARRDAAVRPVVDSFEEIDPLWKGRAVNAADAGAAVVGTWGHVKPDKRIDAHLAELLDHAHVIGDGVERAYCVVRHVLLEDQLAAARREA